MLRRQTLFALAAVAGGSLIAPIRGLAQADATPAPPATGSSPRSGYAPVNGLQMYYESAPHIS